jgi:hypothetical protein
LEVGNRSPTPSRARESIYTKLPGNYHLKQTNERIKTRNPSNYHQNRGERAMPEVGGRKPEVGDKIKDVEN